MGSGVWGLEPSYGWGVEGARVGMVGWRSDTWKRGSLAGSMGVRSAARRRVSGILRSVLRGCLRAVLRGIFHAALRIDGIRSDINDYRELAGDARRVGVIFLAESDLHRPRTRGTVATRGRATGTLWWHRVRLILLTERAKNLPLVALQIVPLTVRGLVIIRQNDVENLPHPELDTARVVRVCHRHIRTRGLEMTRSRLCLRSATSRNNQHRDQSPPTHAASVNAVTPPRANDAEHRHRQPGFSSPNPDAPASRAQCASPRLPTQPTPTPARHPPRSSA
ncbi:Uncharacterised protein [Mycobacteroides abscessus subsp. massiliense]|nr:Uncharacterised protein [Mycobacteroides abscessus subsp. massiliense]